MERCRRGGPAMTTKWLALGLILPGILLSRATSLAGSAHVAYGDVKDSGGGCPAQKDLSFVAYITERPDQVLTQMSVGCTYYEASGTWWVQCGSFPTQWQVGDTVHVDLTDAHGPTGTEYGSVEVVLTTAGYDAGGETTLPVELSWFAAREDNGLVTLEWVTESEVENLGFNLYRSTDWDGEYVKINAEFIEGAGSSATAHTYEYVDSVPDDETVYWYKLEDIDYSGTRTLYGPISTGLNWEDAVVELPVGVRDLTWGRIKSELR